MSWLILVGLVLLLSSTPALSADWEGVIKEGDKLYGKRHDPSRGRENLEGAIKVYEEALKALPKGDKKALSELYVRLARVRFKLAQYYLKDEEEIVETALKGEKEAEKAIEADPQNAGAHYWKAANMGTFREIKRYSRKGGLMGGQIKKGFEKAAELDERCEYARPLMHLAEYLLARGDVEEAKGHAERAVQIEPRALVNQIILAEILWKEGNKVEARQRLEHITSQPEDILPMEILENREIIQGAKRVLKDIEEGREPHF